MIRLIAVFSIHPVVYKVILVSLIGKNSETLDLAELQLVFVFEVLKVVYVSGRLGNPLNLLR